MTQQLSMKHENASVWTSVESINIINTILRT